MGQIIKCMVCKENFEFEDKELHFLKQLFAEGKIQEVVYPKRCIGCRAKKKLPLKHSDSPALAPLKEVSTSLPEAYSHNMHQPKVSDLVAPTPPPPVPAPAPKTEPPLVKVPSVDAYRPDEDLRCVLVAGDFEQLVCREEVVVRLGNQKVTIVLADIGIQAMKSAMKKAVMHWWNS